MIKKPIISFVRVRRPMKGECKLLRKYLSKEKALKKASDD
jgi:hypothetical protein